MPEFSRQEVEDAFATYFNVGPVREDFAQGKTQDNAYCKPSQDAPERRGKDQLQDLHTIRS